MMVSHGAKGGFNLTGMDETDARPTSDMLVGKENLQALFTGMRTLFVGSVKCNSYYLFAN